MFLQSSMQRNEQGQIENIKETGSGREKEEYFKLLMDSQRIEKPAITAGVNKNFSFPMHLYKEFEAVDYDGKHQINATENKQNNRAGSQIRKNLINEEVVEKNKCFKLKNRSDGKKENIFENVVFPERSSGISSNNGRDQKKTSLSQFNQFINRKFDFFKNQKVTEKPHFHKQQLKNRNIFNDDFLGKEVCCDIKGDFYDDRTTVMIKNIPNKLTVSQLKAIIDQFVFGQYNFLYLRIDFINQCNVGYAFINFEDPKTVLLFYEHFNEYEWDKKLFKSNKIVKLAYATIQGFEALKNKFKESMVMKTDPDYRPKLFYTSGPFKGLEKKFT
ncbi:hypothetical protein NUSPORA_01458 [Nucleospora cyclopteri]